MKQLYIKTIAVRLGVKEWQVENCARLFEDGATIPFVSRYRKERTGGLDEVAVAEIKHWIEVFSEMEKRKETILATIAEAGKLTSDLSDAIENCVETTELEDLYLPFRPKRRTRATVAKEAGLEPLADEHLHKPAQGQNRSDVRKSGDHDRRKRTEILCFRARNRAWNAQDEAYCFQTY